MEYPSIFEDHEQSSVLLNKLDTQRGKGHFCDVLFTVNSATQYHAHRNVLAAVSPYFDTVFQPTFNENSMEVIGVECKEPGSFQAVLNYIYSGRVEITENSCEDILKLAFNFSIMKLKEHCSAFLAKNMTAANVYHTKDLAKSYQLSQLSKMADSYAISNIRTIIDMPEILDFNLTRIDHFLANKSMPLTNDQKLKVIGKWVQHKFKEREKLFQCLLPTIDFIKINTDLILDFIVESALLNNSELCMFHMLSALDIHRVLPVILFEKYEFLKKRMEEIEKEAKEKNTPTKESPSKEQENGLDASTNSGLNTSTNSGLNASIDSGPNVSTTNESEHDASMNSQACFPDFKTPSLDPNNTLDEVTDSVTVKREVDHEEPIEEDPIEGISSDEGAIVNKPKVAKNRRKDRRRKGVPIKVEKIPDRIRETKKRRASNESLEEALESEESDNEHNNIIESDSDDSGDKPVVKKRRKRTPNKRKPKGSLKLKLKVNKIKKPRKPRTPKKNQETFSCEHCAYKTPEASKMEKHMKFCADSMESDFKCSVCDYTSKWNKDFFAHMRTHFPGPPYNCDLCNYTGARIQHIIQHRTIHTDEKPFTCSICNMKIRTKTILMLHMKSHTGEKPFGCSVCNRSFTTKGGLEQHLVTHSDARPFLCDTCGFSTKYQSHLIYHKRIHTGDVFRCQYTGCSYSTPKRSQLCCHMRSHMDIRSHICAQCGRSFVEKSHLVRHERIHLAEKPYKCEECDYACTRLDKLKEHTARYHGEGATARVPYKPRKPRQSMPKVSPSASNSAVPISLSALDNREIESSDFPPKTSTTDTSSAYNIYKPSQSVSSHMITSNESSNDIQQQHSMLMAQTISNFGRGVVSGLAFNHPHASHTQPQGIDLSMDATGMLHQSFSQTLANSHSGSVFGVGQPQISSNEQNHGLMLQNIQNYEPHVYTNM